MSPKQSLTATNLAVYQHLSCDLYIHNVYNGTGISNSSNGTSSPSELSKAQYQRGLDWEGILYSWLDRSDLLLKVPAIPLEASTLLENILADGRKHFYITGLTFWPPKHALEKKFRQMGSEPLTFGLAKPDLLEIIRIGDEVQWRVIDAKASKHVKPSHHIQIYFYTLCLNHLLRQPPFHWSNSAGVWLPPNDGFDVASPSIDDIKTISMSLLAPPLDTLLFRDLPRVITSPFDEIKWHYNPLCRGCRYETDCRTRAEKQGELGSMPNISIDDARALKDLLRISRTGSFNSNASSDRLTDIEDLHELVRNQTKFSRLSKSSPTIVKKTKQILSLPKKIRAHQEIESPIVEAARTKFIQVIPRRNYTCPSREDTAVMISIVDDPSSPSSKQSRFHVSAYPKKTPISCSATDIVSNLANLIRLLEAEKTTTQFYVWSSTEQTLLQTHIIHAALTSSASNDDVRVCIGALAQGASLLQTTFQPILLSGALLTFLGKGKRTKAEYKVCLQRMGLPTDGTVEVLRKRIESEIKRLQEQSGTAAHHERRKELGQLPRVVVLKKEIERQLALPIPGYWDLPECAATLNKTRNLCPTDEQVFTAYKHADMETLEYLLTCRNASMFVVLKELRKRAVSAFSGASFLVNEAKVLSTQFMDICKEPHIRKLFFMQQFEVLAKLTELWQSRIDSCPEAPTLEFIGVTQGRNGIEYTFRLISGTVDVPSSDKEYAFFDKLLVEDTPSDEEGGGGDNLPVEVLFDDLGVSGLLFPLNRYTKLHWEKQHARVQQEILVADVRNVYMDAERQHTMVTVRTWGTTNKSILKQGSVYRLSPRLVDFNTTKILSALFEIDLTWESEKEYYGEEEDDTHYGVPFLQLIIDPASFGGVSGSADAKQYVKTEGDIQKLFRDLKGLGNEKAGSLVLKASQHRATQRILSNRLSVIWGPPGTHRENVHDIIVAFTPHRSGTPTIWA
ncbi:hypothetical protein CPC08DRAFT_735698 [Agrocybe pediades]|nr:hypothetical protein CPC08DRAFT_735698 [Agrocybe pediades]